MLQRRYGSAELPYRLFIQQEEMNLNTIRKIYGTLNKISGVAQKILEAVVAFLILTCALDLFFQVIYRFIIIKFFSFSFPFTEEYARYALIWVTYLCAGMCLKNGSMASVNFIYDRLKLPARRILYYFTRVLFIIFLIVGIRFGFQHILNSQIYKSPVMRVPGVYLYSAPFVGCILMIYEMITEVLGVICGEIEPFKGRPEPVNEAEQEGLE